MADKLEKELKELQAKIEHKKAEFDLEQEKQAAKKKYDEAKLAWEKIKDATVESEANRKWREKEKADKEYREWSNRVYEESRNRPAHWPYPRANMSKEERDEWHEAHNL